MSQVRAVLVEHVERRVLLVPGESGLNPQTPSVVEEERVQFGVGVGDAGSVHLAALAYEPRIARHHAVAVRASYGNGADFPFHDTLHATGERVPGQPVAVADGNP